MPINLEATIQNVLSRAMSGMAGEIAAAVRSSLGQQIASIIRGEGGEASQVAKRGPGRPRKSAAVGSPEAATPKAATRGKRAAGGRRTSEQVAQDDLKILEIVRAHPGKRSQDLQKQTGLPKLNLAFGLKRLRQSGKIKMKGTKSSATYSAA